MKSIAKALETLRREKPFLEKEFSVKRLSLFGSRVRGGHRKKSDLDVLVEFQKPVDFFKFLQLEEHLSSELRVKVDLVSKKSLKPHIGARILSEAVPV